MKSKKQNILLIICLSLLLSNCNKIIPTGFWNNYKSELISENISDQGPFGGHRAMLWKSENGKKFNAKEIIEFASENGWKLTGTEKYSKKEVEKWKSGGKPIFPLTSLGFKPNNFDDFSVEEFPRWTKTNLTVYKFKTNFVTIEPGTDNSIEENGFIVINEAETEMSLYNLWGE